MGELGQGWTMSIRFYAIGIWGLRRGCSARTSSKGTQGDMVMRAMFARGSWWVLGAAVPQAGGSSLGGVVFVLSGVACLGAILFVWRGFMKRGLLKK